MPSTWNPSAKYSGTTRTEVLSGKISWHNLSQVNAEGEWKLTLYPDTAALEIINKLIEEGLLNKLRKDDEGYNMTFKRVQKKRIKDREITFTAPVVIDADGKPTDGMGIGHGSDVEIALQVYKYRSPQGNKSGTACRLEAVKIKSLVPFESKRDMSTEEMFKLRAFQTPSN